ncbi:MAG: radical SAM protein [Lewinellaceae bacterium]|nr:radical SAM protein [Lewinellaceae bacterium]
MDEIKCIPVDAVTLKAHQQTRSLNAHRKLCHAPFQNMYFGRDGKVLACCYNREEAMGRWPEQTIAEIWSSAQAEALRQAIGEDSLASGCYYCHQILDAGNFFNMPARHFDKYADPPIASLSKQMWQLFTQRVSLGELRHRLRSGGAFYSRKIREIFEGRQPGMPLGRIIRQEAGQLAARARARHKPQVANSFPRGMEFELSNTCNLECVMCTGEFSSSIRKNREGLAPYPELYGLEFAQQLEAFIPYLWQAKFYGGEPFLVPIYFEIWERMARLNPHLSAHITTNGTVFNNKVRDVLEKVRTHLIVSIDSFHKETYESIRQNARFERVMESIDYYAGVNHRQHSELSIAICPMILNYMEMPEMVAACNRRGFNVFFNTVWFPEELSLRKLPAEELEKAIRYYEAHYPTGEGLLAKRNLEAFDGLLNQLKNWHSHALERTQTSS